jgi:penicillin-binding protein 2
LLASPLQVAQAMAGIGNGGALPKLQLIRQVQDTRGRVVKATLPDRKRPLGVSSKSVDIVHKGMSDVVNAGGGTGQSAGLSYTTLCGKTGTAEWGPKANNQRLAWFAGFLPEDNPRYAFAVLYEGRPGETVSGGRMAAPMVKKFFEGIKGDIKDIIAPPQKALMVVDEDESVPDKAVAVPTDPEEEPIEVPEEGALKAIPVIPTEVPQLREEMDVRDLEPPPRQMPRAIRAIPVEDDEVILDTIEEP